MDIKLKAGYVILCILSGINLYRMVHYYLFKHPNQWHLGTRGALDNIGTLYFPALMMYIHLIMGFIVTILSLLQILPVFRRPGYIKYHRLMGDIYCFCCLIASIAGNIFIYTNGTAGGFNMSVAFSVYGWMMFYFSVKTYYYAKKYQKTKNKIHLMWHRESSIRLWALGISGLVYRVNYLILLWCGYQITSSLDFRRLLDSIMVWEFFLAPMFVTELFLRGKL